MYASVVEWLEYTAEDKPNNLALVDETESLTYREYRSKALRIAAEIVERGYGPKKPIVVFLPKSVRVLVSFMGIAYSGCFYSPIDVDMPESRADKILEVLNPGIVITSAELKEKFDNYNFEGDYIIYEEITEKCSISRNLPADQLYDLNDKVASRFTNTIDTDLLYVLFTSGSTGTPKGVSITHRGVLDYTDWVTETFEIEQTDRFGNQAPFYFDNSILDIYSTMKMGAAMFIIPKNLFAQPVRLLEYIKENRINTIFWVPSALMMVSKLKAFRNVDVSDVLTRVLFCGEVMPNKQLNIWRKYLPKPLYANLYGPTEITDACTYYIVDREFADDESLPIGFAMKNTQILVLDDEDHLVAEPGKVGELCVRGTGVMAGYYRNPEKTAAALVQNPLQDAYEEKIYRTGDLVEYNERGEIIYLSRKDFQIKHMGHRIELGEIETAVSSLEGVGSCCCLYDEARSKIVLFLDRDMDKDQINKKLCDMIPEYMLPGKVIYMETLPLNANGKIDRVELKGYI